MAGISVGGEIHRYIMCAHNMNMWSSDIDMVLEPLTIFNLIFIKPKVSLSKP